MGVIQFLDELRALHVKARRGELAESEKPTYRQAREEFEKAIVVVQGLTLGKDVRRSFRIAVTLPVELQMHYGYVVTQSLDLSVGGFSAMMPHPMGADELPSYTMELPEGKVLAGQVRLASQRPVGDKHRVSFAFTDNTEWQTEELEMLLIDMVLERVQHTTL